MAEFKLVISDPKTGKSMQKEVKDNEATPFVGKKLGEKVNGEGFGLQGYEFSITGGSDKSGFPMRKGILSNRKRILTYGGVGFKGAAKGIKKRKTVCGQTINDSTVQINLKILKAGKDNLFEAKKEEAPKKEAPKKEAPKAEAPKKEEKKPEPKKEEPKKEEAKK